VLKKTIIYSGDHDSLLRSSNINQLNYWIDNKLNCLIYLIIFYLGLWFIFGPTH